MRLEPNVAPANVTLAYYFKPVLTSYYFGLALPLEVLLRGAKARAPRSAERARAEHARRAPLHAR